ncbi:MAG: hypothetical protein MJ058_04130 [Akkermansia sp.]|nr:hypothetical protein [Akkermansia sp.]
MEQGNQDAQAQTQDAQVQAQEPAPGIDAVASVTHEPLKFREGVALDDRTRQAFQDLYDGKVSHQQFLDGFFDRIVEVDRENRQRAAVKAEDQAKAWKAEMASDEEFGGVRLDATVEAANRAVKHCSPDGSLGAVLKEHGLERNPAVLRAFARIGLGLQEDRSGDIGSVSPEQAFLERMYGPQK